MRNALSFWPPARGTRRSPWEDGGHPGCDGMAEKNVDRLIAEAGLRRGRVLVTHVARGTAPAFWGTLFERVETLVETDAALQVVEDGRYRFLCGSRQPPSRFKIRDAAGPADALVVDAPTPADAVSLYFLFRRCLTPPALVLFVHSLHRPGAGVLAARLAEGVLDGVSHAIRPLLPTMDGTGIACEILDHLPPCPASPDRAPRWLPSSGDTGAIPVPSPLRTVVPGLYGCVVMRWFGCFIATRHPLAGGAPGGGFTGRPADYHIGSSLRALAKTLEAGSKTEDEHAPRPGEALARTIDRLAGNSAIAVWGMGSDLLRALAGRSHLEAPFASGRITLADRLQAGGRFCGNRILSPAELAATGLPILLGSQSPTTREALRMDAQALGIARDRLIDPSPEA